MPAAARSQLIDTISTGHPCDATAKIQGPLQTTVYINGNLGAVNGDQIQVHNTLVGEVCLPHPAEVNAGSSTVFFGGIAAARLGDSADAGSIITGSSDVFIGG